MTEGYMAETIGSLIDKLCISELKIFHMREQVDRPDASPAHQQQCRQRLGVLTCQRDGLANELNDLTRRWSRGRWAPKVYHQFKMYNDPKYKMPPPAVHAAS